MARSSLRWKRWLNEKTIGKFGFSESNYPHRGTSLDTHYWVNYKFWILPRPYIKRNKCGISRSKKLNILLELFLFKGGILSPLVKISYLKAISTICAKKNFPLLLQEKKLVKYSSDSCQREFYKFEHHNLQLATLIEEILKIIFFKNKIKTGKIIRRQKINSGPAKNFT